MRIFNLLAFFVVAAFGGCTDNVNSPNLDSPIEFSLEYGNSVTIDNTVMTITFAGEVSESRCPTGVVCVWPGFARISLNVDHSNGESIILPLSVFGAERDTLQALNFQVDTLGYKFSLRSLSPYPVDPDDPVPVTAYVARIRIAKTASSGNQVTITDNPAQHFLLGSYDIDSGQVVGDTLSVWVNYGGGCEPHEFNLFMTPAAFAESDPVQANLYLQHIDHGDRCEALLYERLDFDISAIGDLYRASYQSGGTVLLNLFEYNSSHLTNVMQVSYQAP